MKKSNNRGFSLVELLVAIVILGLVVVPLLHAFITAAVTSAKSRQAGAATTAAQNAVEVIQANTVDAILRGKPETVADLFGATSAVWDDDVLTLTGVSSGDRQFDLDITLNPDAYVAVNEIPITQFTSMDAVYTQDSAGADPDTQAENLFNGRYPSAEITGRSRTLRMALTRQDGSEGKKRVQISLWFEYLFRFRDTRIVDGVEESYSGSESVRSNTYTLLPGDYQIEEDEKVSVYVFFSPYYQGGSPNDTIEIDNKSNQPCKLFLVKQKTPGTAAGEATYQSKVILREKHAGDSDPFAATIFSNVGVNLNTDMGLHYQYFRYDGAFREDGSFSGELVDRQPEDRLYNVQVEVYPAGESDSALTFRASKLQ